MTLLLADFRYKQKFEHVFQLYSCGLIFIDEKGIILEVNANIEEILQTNRETLYGMHAVHLLENLRESYENKQTFIETLLRDGHAELCSDFVSTSGEVKHIRIIVSKQKSTKLYLTEVHDESEKVKMKKRLDHTESLSTLGQLAASIAHEIRNPMTSLKGFTQLLYKTANEDGKRYLSVINDEINRMEEILTEFLEVSKPSNYKYSYFDVKAIIVEVINFMAPQAFMQNIKVTLNCKIDHTCRIFGDRSLLKQVFMNALKNAIEAMSNGGVIHINIANSKDNSQLCIAIEDQGHGISEENLEKVFDPYFTTKASGTGLGLSRISKVIEEHGGSLEVSSIVGEGTTLNIFLPLHHENSALLTI